MCIALGCVRRVGFFFFWAAVFDGPPSSDAPGELRACSQSPRFLALRNGSQLYQTHQLYSEVFATLSLGTWARWLESSRYDSLLASHLSRVASLLVGHEGRGEKKKLKDGPRFSV